jgi:hypothetical protein
MPDLRVMYEDYLDNEELRNELNKLKFNISLPSFSPCKRDILRRVIAYAEVYTTRSERDTDKGKQRFRTCQAIFDRINFPDILFLQYVIIQLEKIYDFRSILRDSVRPYAYAQRNKLLVPIIENLRITAVGLGVAALGTGNSKFGFIAAAMFVLSEDVAKYCILLDLKDYLIKRSLTLFNSNVTISRRNRTQNDIDVLTNFAASCQQAFMRFFGIAPSVSAPPPQVSNAIMPKKI